MKLNGRCLTLDYAQTRASETALVLKFNTLNFTEGVEVDLKITGRLGIFNEDVLDVMGPLPVYVSRSTQGPLPTRYFQLCWG